MSEQYEASLCRIATDRLQRYAFTAAGAEFGLPQALDNNGSRYEVLNAAILIEPTDTIDDVQRRLSLLEGRCRQAVEENSREGDGLYIRSGPHIEWSEKPKRVPAGFKVADIWEYPTAIAAISCYFRCSRKNGTPLSETYIPIKAENAPWNIICEEPA